MILSDDARAIRKKLQTDRLAEKAAAAAANKGKSADDSDYSSYAAFYAAQGLQVAKAEHNAKITQARGLVRSTADDIKLAKVTGAGIREAMAAHATARATLKALEDDKRAMFGRSTTAVLSGGGA